MKSNITSSKKTKITKTKIERKVRKIWKMLKPLYIIYELSQLTKTSNYNTNYLINIISKTEYKYVSYLKKQYEQRNIQATIDRKNR